MTLKLDRRGHICPLHLRLIHPSYHPCLPGTSTSKYQYSKSTGTYPQSPPTMHHPPHQKTSTAARQIAVPPAARSLRNIRAIPLLRPRAAVVCHFSLSLSACVACVAPPPFCDARYRHSARQGACPCPASFGSAARAPLTLLLLSKMSCPPWAENPASIWLERPGGRGGGKQSPIHIHLISTGKKKRPFAQTCPTASFPNTNLSQTRNTHTTHTPTAQPRQVLPRILA